MEEQEQFQRGQTDSRQLKLRAIQMEELDIILELQRICQEYGIRYYLTGGTLLGAVRHEGFIPWDDDIDVAMPRKDFDRFARVCPDALSMAYFYQSIQTEKNYPYYYAKIRKRGTSANEPATRCIQMEQGIFIDIFPLDSCPERDSLAKLFFKGMQLLTCAVLARVSSEFVCGYEKRSARLLWNLLRRFPNKWLFVLRDCLRKIFGLAASGELVCNVSGRYGFPQEVCKTGWFAHKTELPFEKHWFPVPSGWNELLTTVYGDYMTPLAEADRQGHFSL